MAPAELNESFRRPVRRNWHGALVEGRFRISILVDGEHPMGLTWQGKAAVFFVDWIFQAWHSQEFESSSSVPLVAGCLSLYGLIVIPTCRSQLENTQGEQRRNCSHVQPAPATVPVQSLPAQQ